MKQLLWLFVLCLTTGALASPQSRQSQRTVSVGRGLDTGLDAIAAANLTKLPASDGRNGWLRLRGLGRSGERMQETRTALRKLRADGWLLCVLLHRPADGQTEAGTGGDTQVTGLPFDLRPVFESSRRLSAMYGDLIDAWEVENEPDLGFVPALPENYATYLKASYLGFKSRRKEPGAGSSSVLMGALGLPPGPWLERFAVNDGLGYTDGFSYHYYGYAEDFTGVYRQHEAAVKELGASSTELGANGSKLIAKSLPIFLTEIGYGMLGKMAMSTKEGRLRQWRWFKSTGGLSDDLGISGTMTFMLTPYLERDTLEFGLTVPRPDAAAGNKEQGAGSFRAGNIEYQPRDFGAMEVEPWMQMIGKEIGGKEITPALAWWMSAQSRCKEHGAGSRSWEVSAPAPSPVVIDFQAGEGLQPLKRYNGIFVTGNVPPGMRPEEAKPVLPPMVRPPKPPKPPRSEEFMIHVRTQNGNLFEVYPTRQATPEWQTYLEQHDNFTMSFYGRAEQPWRFHNNRPVSLVVVMYPKALPATYEFRRVQLLKLGDKSLEPGARPVAELKAQSTQLEAAVRYGQGKIVLYNFSDKPIAGRLILPDCLTTEHTEDTEMMTLTPNGRREVSVVIQVGTTRFERNQAVITFVPADREIAPARFVTEFFPALEGLETSVVANLTNPFTTDYTDQKLANCEIIANRQLAIEEAKGILQPANGFLAQQGAAIERTADGFRVTVTGRVPGKPQRVEVELPWPDGLAFSPEAFLSLEYRLGTER